MRIVLTGEGNSSIASMRAGPSAGAERLSLVRTASSGLGLLTVLGGGILCDDEEGGRFSASEDCGEPVAESRAASRVARGVACWAEEGTREDSRGFCGVGVGSNSSFGGVVR